MGDAAAWHGLAGSGAATYRVMTRADLTGRIAIVTGATAGIGREIAAGLLAEGAVVVGCARDAERLAEVARKLPGLVPVRCDVRDAADRAMLVATTVDRFGRVDLLVNNAGVGYVGAVVDMTADDIQRIMDTNVTGLIDLTRLVLPQMIERGDGDVLMVSSAAVWLSMPPLTAYAASKFAVNGFVEGLRREVAQSGVRIHSVNPGFVSSEFLARALKSRPHEDDPGVADSPGTSPEKVARVALRQLHKSRSRTVAVPRYMALGRLVGVPPLTHVADLGIRIFARRLERLGRQIAYDRTPKERAGTGV